mmetsp:Transcript_12010/g.28802  ORF Transcript_12010/g.28802 Transcript_12010/m.28802 type:complete len:125 (-) Transcript_12010:194-568(-)
MTSVINQVSSTPNVQEGTSRPSEDTSIAKALPSSAKPATCIDEPATHTVSHLTHTRAFDTKNTHEQMNVLGLARQRASPQQGQTVTTHSLAEGSEVSTRNSLTDAQTQHHAIVELRRELGRTRD